MMKHIDKSRFAVRYLLIAAITLTACLLCAGCGGKEAAQEAVPVFEETPVPTPIPTPTATPVPESVSFDMVTPTPTMTPVPTPTPTPTPSATEVPFSYYAPTVNMTFEELVGGTSDFGEMGSKNVKWPEAYPPADTYKLVVDIYWQVTAAYRKDENGEYTIPVRYMLCSTGDPSIPDGGETRRGTFNLLVPRVRYGHFLSGEAAQYWSLIRSRTYFHSILYDKQNKMSTYQAETYKALGSKNSHGCIRLTVPDARWIWYNCGYGTLCEIRDGSKNDEEMRYVRENLILPDPPAKQATITAGATPYTDNWTIDTVLSAFDPDTWLPFKNEKQPAPALKAEDDSTDAGQKTPEPGNDPEIIVPTEPDPYEPIIEPANDPEPQEPESDPDKESDNGGIEFATGTP